MRGGGPPTWPESFLSGAEQLRAGMSYCSEPLGRNIAVNLRQRWHQFRIAMHRERHPTAEALTNTMCCLEQIEDNLYQLQWVYFGPKGGIEQLRPKAAQIDNRQLDYEEKSSGECQHSPNEYGICTKCGADGLLPRRE